MASSGRKATLYPDSVTDSAQVSVHPAGRAANFEENYAKLHHDDDAVGQHHRVPVCPIPSLPILCLYCLGDAVPALEIAARCRPFVSAVVCAGMGVGRVSEHKRELDLCGDGSGHNGCSSVFRNGRRCAGGCKGGSKECQGEEKVEIYIERAESEFTFAFCILLFHLCELSPHSSSESLGGILPTLDSSSESLRS